MRWCVFTMFPSCPSCLLCPRCLFSGLSVQRCEGLGGTPLSCVVKCMKNNNYDITDKLREFQFRLLLYMPTPL